MIDILTNAGGPENRTLFERLARALSPDEMDLARRLCVELIAATIYAPFPTQRAAGTTFFLLLDAFNSNRSARARELRWRRVITALAALNREVELGAPLHSLLVENRDLITQQQRPFPRVRSKFQFDSAHASASSFALP